ncbi:MAG: ECF transporter S component [Clostridia bacterium]|nr:ECF transporter S component [Clostridia bacterium]
MKKWLFSETLLALSASKRIAYIAVMTAFTVVANMFFEFKFAEVQFSLTLAVSALTGIFLGPLAGFCACFLGDLVGFFYNSAGFAYYPWIGISMGLAAAIASLCLRLPLKNVTIKLLLASVLTFAVCTVGINTTSFYLLYGKGVGYGTYLVARLFVQGQIWNSVVNLILLLIVTPALAAVKPLGMKLS